MTPTPLRICYFGTYRANYTRNQILINGLRAQDNVILNTCHATLWHSIADRVEQASGGWRHPRFWWRVLRTYAQLLRAYRNTPDYDIMLIGYPGQFDAYLGRLLTWLHRKPLALDILMSLHLVAEERGLTTSSPATGKLLFLLEKIGLHLPDHLIAENQEYQNYIATKYTLPADRFVRLPHGVNNQMYAPRPHISPPSDEFRIVYHGTFLPSHGLPTILAAAHQLQDQPHYQFHFYGRGPGRDAALAYAADNALTNLTFHGWVTDDELLDGLASAHIILGIFGTTRQSLMTAQNKIWEGLAMGRPMISGDAATIREFLTPDEHIHLIPRADPTALATALQTLAADPEGREAMAGRGQMYVRENHAISALGQQLAALLAAMVPNDSPPHPSQTSEVSTHNLPPK